MGNSHGSRDTSEEDRIERERVATVAARVAAEAQRVKYAMLRSIFVNERESPYAQNLGDIYAKNQTPEDLASYNEAIEVDNIASKITSCNTDDDVYEIMQKTSIMLDGYKKNSTKVYFLSEVILKSFGHFYNYNKENSETQYNFLINTFPKTFKDDVYVKNKYKKFISLIALANISKNMTFNSLPPNSDYFLKISDPIIKESKKYIDEFKQIRYKGNTVNEINPANDDMQDKYKIIVTNV